MRRVRLLFFLPLLVLPLAVVHQPADRRLLVRRNLHQVHARLPRQAHRLQGGNDAHLLIGFVDQADGRDANLFVATQTVLANGGSSLQVLGPADRQRPSRTPIKPASFYPIVVEGSNSRGRGKFLGGLLLAAMLASRCAPFACVGIVRAQGKPTPLTSLPPPGKLRCPIPRAIAYDGGGTTKNTKHTKNRMTNGKFPH